MRPRRTYGYTRVSSDEQGRHGTSLEAQRDEIARYCRARGWPEPTLYREIQSGSAERLEHRVELQALLRELDAGDVVLVAKTDRWSRDLVHTVASVRALIKRGVGWIAIGESLDASTPHGDQVLGIMAWTADAERARIRERTVGRRRDLRETGAWIDGAVPFGFRRDRATRRLVVVESEAAVVRDVYRRCIAGESIVAIARELVTAQIGREGKAPIRWDKKAVHNLLRRRWYLGETRRASGAWLPAHPPIVDPDTFARAQNALGGRKLGGRTPSAESRTQSWLLRSLATCGSCGSRMGSAFSRAAATDGYYACAARLRGGECDEPYARVLPTDERTAALVVRRLEELRELLASAELPTATTDTARVDALRKSLEGLRLRRQRLVSLAVDGLVSRDELAARSKVLELETAHTEAALRLEERRAAPVTAEARADVLRDVLELRGRWRRLEPPQRRAIVALLAERVVLEDGQPRVTWASVESLCAATVGSHLSDGTVAESAKPVRKVGERR